MLVEGTKGTKEIDAVKMNLADCDCDRHGGRQTFDDHAAKQTPTTTFSLLHFLLFFFYLLLMGHSRREEEESPKLFSTQPHPIQLVHSESVHDH